VKLVEKLTDPIKIILMTIVAAAVVIVLMIITRSACAVWFCQPKQPTAMQNVINRKRGETCEKS